MSYMHSPGKLGLTSHPSSFGADTTSKYSYFNDKRSIGFGDAMNLTQIHFVYVAGQTYNLVNRQLKLHNQSRTHYVKFEIQCNNPHHYKVFPSLGDIPPGKIVEISIQIVGIQEISEMKRNFFAKFASDRFKISWNSCKQSDRGFQQTMSKVVKRSNFRILKVSVEYKEEPNYEHEVRKTPADVQKRVQFNLQIHKRELQKLQKTIAEKERQKTNQTWIYPKLIIFFSFAAFLAGLFLPF